MREHAPRRREAPVVQVGDAVARGTQAAEALEAIVGFDDIPEAHWVRPRLTTVAQHPGEMGRLLATALFDRIERDGASDPGRRVFEVPCQFVERESA
jgi:DNA-binding LacI/PurR family transcriptional regulator